MQQASTAHHAAGVALSTSRINTRKGLHKRIMTSMCEDPLFLGIEPFQFHDAAAVPILRTLILQVVELCCMRGLEMKEQHRYEGSTDIREHARFPVRLQRSKEATHHATLHEGRRAEDIQHQHIRLKVQDGAAQLLQVLLKHTKK
eukprot:1160071-Pelagomonas_calceolata.AAC.10